MLHRQQKTPSAPKDWAVILAGGDGMRLKAFTRVISGDERPKQFCSILGQETLLEQTRQRVQIAIAPEQTLYVVNQQHEEFYAPLLNRRAASGLVAQPCNRGTAPAILYSLLRIAAVDPGALVAFFPSDHFISDDKQFMRHIQDALAFVQRRSELVVLLGLEPESPEVEYGWIEPGAAIADEEQTFRVQRFWEKPNEALAQVLQLRGCLWNSFVMVASVQALLEMIDASIPALNSSFSRVTPLLGTRKEPEAIARLYAQLEESNFSHQVLTRSPERLAVLRVTGVRWNDLGEPKRVLASLNMAGIRPHWAQAAAPQFV